MIRKEDVYKIGKIGKAHGVKGELSFMFDDDIFDRADADYLILEVDGILVPFFMEEYRFRSDSTALVKFCDIDTLERAKELTNCDVFLPRNMNEDQEDITWTYFVGFTIIDHDSQKTVGRIASIDDTTINILFCLEDGLLIPASEDLITAIDQNKKTITMALPQGIFDI
ncbi:ribosome maturation factor RimM [Prevotella sp. E13-17]|uniref:ribosome maturation factor RimM n=1 Tax=Prevotella sp. E13-17 TaxID=2913616 RepID=UPI001EDA44E3|nr:ribosome maturation factor RimM [Prevotella sp. E13-17]UKK51441.1 ribosome maturation factor RimM [Prevotella sp. E13-17]